MIRELDDLARAFKALGDPTRLALMALLLSEGELCVCDCEQALGITQSRTSRHLRYLAQAGLVQGRRVGAWVHYRVVDAPDPERAVIIEAARSVLAGERSAGVRAALERWRGCKPADGLGGGCGGGLGAGTAGPASGGGRSEPEPGTEGSAA